MKYLFYTTYCSGRAGLSNSIMSTELGVLLAFLTDRVLVLDGNISPRAKVEAYGGELTNRHLSRPTDLLDIPVPWLEPEQIDLRGRGRSMELTGRSLAESVFFYPASLDLDTEDFRRFAQGRRAAFTYGGEYRDAAILRLSGGPEIGQDRYKMHNFGFYGPFLYLDGASKKRVHHLLRAMCPKRHFVEFGDRVTAALGAFNAVHIRRGDFKQTYGRTTFLRRPREAIEVLDHNFSRGDRLVILTDEGDDPFVAEIVQAYPDAVLLDRFILDELEEEFRDLPHHDSVALAFLCRADRRACARLRRHHDQHLLGAHSTLARQQRSRRALQVSMERASSRQRPHLARCHGDQQGRPDAPRRHHGRGVRGSLLVEPLRLPAQFCLDARVAGEFLTLVGLAGLQ